MLPAGQAFSAYGPSHCAVLVVAVVGVLGFVVFGRHAEPRWSRRVCVGLAVLIASVNLGIEVYSVQPANLAGSLPLQLSDLAPYAAAYALWSRRHWAFSLTYYWCLTLSSQALLTPALRGPDYPSIEFFAFFANHLLVIWAAVLLAWGLREPVTWGGYRFTVAATAAWAAVAFGFNIAAGTNYGFLNGKPPVASLLDLLGPWPWYLVPEAVLVLTVWALLTVLGRHLGARLPPRGGETSSAARSS